RWGDTLWDISEAFYRNPWLYPRIARFNNIRRPDLIVAGSVIRIPPRN
ncbi:MAG: LysM peptidoglycan-binding domain-containing protein, partial [Treponema sp.]|nr:LysM peptidoglycan-binding domain-containing protein [Treponema sp.]